MNSVRQKIKFSPRCYSRFDFFMAERLVLFVLHYDNVQVWRWMPSFLVETVPSVSTVETEAGYFRDSW